jgi:hypothetical protein
MDSVALEALNTHPYADKDLWRLGEEKNWDDLKRILAPITGNDFAVTELKHRLLIDDVRRRFDSSKDGNGNTILNPILLTNAADKRRMADVADLVLSVGVHPDMPDDKGLRPAHIVSFRACVELVSTIFACRPDMTALDNNEDTPLMAALRVNYVSTTQNQTPGRCPSCPSFQLVSDVSTFTPQSMLRAHVD